MTSTLTILNVVMHVSSFYVEKNLASSRRFSLIMMESNFCCSLIDHEKKTDYDKSLGIC